MKKLSVVGCTFALLAILLPFRSQAVDGVFEISQSCANFGCFVDDLGGLPVTISNSGSYRLTSNVVVSANTTAVEVNADNVSIDLNGFTISGPISCSGTTLVCSSSGNGNGISVINGRDGLIVRNGIINGMGALGISMPTGVENALVEGLVLSNNAGGGMTMQSGSLARNLNVYQNGVSGVSGLFAAAYVMDSVVRNNSAFGVFGIFCGNVLMSGNDGGNACVAIAPNKCDNATDCD